MAYNATEQYEGVFEDFLLKEASCETQVDPCDEKKYVRGVNSSQAAPFPDDRGEHTTDAPWGESDAPKDSKHLPVQHYSDAVLTNIIHTRQGMLDALLDTKKPAARADRALINQQFEHARSGDYESKAPLLEQGAGSMGPGATLREMVNGILGK